MVCLQWQHYHDRVQNRNARSKLDLISYVLARNVVDHDYSLSCRLRSEASVNVALLRVLHSATPSEPLCTTTAAVYVAYEADVFPMVGGRPDVLLCTKISERIKTVNQVCTVPEMGYGGHYVIME